MATEAAEAKIEVVPFRDVPPGRSCRIEDRVYVRVDPDCEFAQALEPPRFYAVMRGTGLLTFIGPDTLVKTVTGLV